MKKLLTTFTFLPFFGYAQPSTIQNAMIDSLKKVINTAEHDTTLVKALIKWDQLIYITDPNLDYQLNKRIDSISTIHLKNTKDHKITHFFMEAQGNALINLGSVHYNRGEYSLAKKYFTQSLSSYKKAGNYKGKASALNNLGLIYKIQGDHVNAIKVYMQSLKIYERIESNMGIALSLNNIGLVYHLQNNYSKAINHYKKSIEYREKVGDKNGTADPLNNIGSIYKEWGDLARVSGDLTLSEKRYKKAMHYFNKSFEISKGINNKQGIASYLNNAGGIYKERGKSAVNTKLANEMFEKALNFFMQSLTLRKEINDKKGIAASLNNIAVVYYIQKKYKQAINYSTQSLAIAKEIKVALEIVSAANTLWKVNKHLGRYKESLAMYELYVSIRDSIESEANQKEVIRQQYKYEYEKQAAADSVKAAEAAKVKDAQLAAQRAENARQQQQAYYLYGGLALALLFGGFIFNRFRVTSKQKKVIEHQKTEVEKQRELADSQRQLAEEQKKVVEEKNKEIIDSINYAKRLQEAILPPKKLVKEYLQQSFILYKPKDIVAGDFYWMETVGDTVYFAAADCTGHGVPGAMVSVVCSNALSKALTEENITDVGKLLDRTRELVVERFGRSEENIQDGMDLALCALNNKTNELHYSGANNPLWIIRKGATEVEETKADKQPIGKYDKEDPFTAHTLQLNQGDSLYIFSDGYPDQFGGDKGKKYKTGAMKKFLLSIQDKDLPTQRQLLNEEFENWKGELEQIDDVCVIGVRV